MKLAIIDDKERDTELLAQYVARFSAENDMKIFRRVFHNPVEFLDSYSMDYDLIVLKAELPGMNGIDTAREIRRMDRRVVIMFVANIERYAVNGYEVGAVDYVMRPVEYPHFARKLGKACRYITSRQERRLVLPTSEGVVTVRVSDICYVEVDRHYLVYHTVHGDYVVRGVMRDAERQLREYHFVRCNSCYLVDLKYVEAVNGTFVRVGGMDLQISRNKRSEFLNAFIRYAGGMAGRGRIPAAAEN